MNDEIDLPPLPYPQIPGNDYDPRDMWDYALAAIKADRQQRGEPVAWMTSDKRHIAFGDRLTKEEATRYGWAPLYTAPQPATPAQQYYYRVTGCTADKTTAPNCICWHDKGTGPFPEHKEGIEVGGVLVSWRVKPTSSTQEPSVGQIMEAVKSYGSVCRQPNTTVSEQEMRLHEIHALLARYGANHE